MLVVAGWLTPGVVSPWYGMRRLVRQEVQTWLGLQVPLSGWEGPYEEVAWPPLLASLDLSEEWALAFPYRPHVVVHCVRGPTRARWIWSVWYVRFRVLPLCPR